MKQNGSTSCPRSGYECGPCFDGQFQELSTNGDFSEKCRPWPGNQAVTTTQKPAFGSEDRWQDWFQDNSLSATIIFIAAIILVLLISFVTWKCYQDRRQGNYSPVPDLNKACFNEVSRLLQNCSPQSYDVIYE